MNRLLGAVRRSLFARLLLIFVLTALAFAALDNLFDAFSDRERPYKHLLRSHLGAYADYLAADIGALPDLARARQLAKDLPLDIRIQGPALDWRSHPSFPDLESLDFDATGYAREWRRGPRYFLRHRSGEYTLAFAAPPFGHEFRHSAGRHFKLAGSLTIVLLCYLAVRRLFAPIRLLRTGVQRIGAGDLGHRVAVRRSDELGELAAAVNTMAGEVEQMLESKRQLLFAISHELRSPMTRARLALELSDASDKQPLIDDLDQMERIIADLLEGERLGSRHSVLQREPTGIDTLAGQLLADEFAAEAARIHLISPPDLPALDVDPARIRLLLRNLLRNALAYGGDAPVELSLEANGGHLVIRVTDRGAGIAAEHLDKVTDPFYRVDASRTRGSGGIGLGLYLCRRIAEAHGGSLQLTSAPGTGTTATVYLPR